MESDKTQTTETTKVDVTRQGLDEEEQRDQNPVELANLLSLIDIIERGDFSKLAVGRIRIICRLVISTLGGGYSEPLVKIQGPCTIVGDIHGDLEALRYILQQTGIPPKHPIVFLGDYVDRGEKSLEVILTLFILKIAYPDKIILVRGNHETESINLSFGGSHLFKAVVLRIVIEQDEYEQARDEALQLSLKYKQYFDRGEIPRKLIKYLFNQKHRSQIEAALESFNREENSHRIEFDETNQKVWMKIFNSSGKPLGSHEMSDAVHAISNFLQEHVSHDLGVLWIYTMKDAVSNIAKGNISYLLSFKFFQHHHGDAHQDIGTVFKCFNEVFNHLPLAAIITQPGHTELTAEHKGIFCVHGGIGPNTNSIENLTQRLAKGGRDESQLGPIGKELLWSDPGIQSGFNDNERGVGCEYGPDVTQEFCRRSHISKIIRGHSHHTEECFEKLVKTTDGRSEFVKLNERLEMTTERQEGEAVVTTAPVSSVSPGAGQAEPSAASGPKAGTTGTVVSPAEIAAAPAAPVAVSAVTTMPVSSQASTSSQTIFSKGLRQASVSPTVSTATSAPAKPLQVAGPPAPAPEVKETQIMLWPTPAKVCLGLAIVLSVFALIVAALVFLPAIAIIPLAIGIYVLGGIGVGIATTTAITAASKISANRTEETPPVNHGLGDVDHVESVLDPKAKQAVDVSKSSRDS